MASGVPAREPTAPFVMCFSRADDLCGGVDDHARSRPAHRDNLLKREALRAEARPRRADGTNGFTSNAIVRSNTNNLTRCVRGNGTGEAAGAYAVEPPNHYRTVFPNTIGTCDETSW